LKIKIKHNLIIFEEPYEWEPVRDQIKKDYGPNIFTISWRLKRELGFTVRHHKGLRPADGEENKVLSGRFFYSPEVHLDFYNEATLSWFCLKYINNTEI
jgi:hypothetical protein